MEHKDFYSVKEFAKVLGVHYNTIRRMIIAKRIDAVLLNPGQRKTYRIPASEITRMAKMDLSEYIEMEVQRRLKERK